MHNSYYVISFSTFVLCTHIFLFRHSTRGLMPLRQLDQGRPSPLLSRRNIDSPNGLLSPRLTRRTFGSTTPGSKPAPAM